MFRKMTERERQEIAGVRPFFWMVILVILIAYLLSLNARPALQKPGPLALFTMLMLVHGWLHWHSPRLTLVIDRPNWWAWFGIYFIVQGAIVVAIGVLTGLQDLTLGLFMGLIGEATGILWPNLRAIALAIAFCLLLMVIFFVLTWSPGLFGRVAPVVGFVLLFVLTYVIMFVRQAEAGNKAQRLLDELEIAHRQLQEYADQIEELTIAQERQRMARELHDTLAQGLAGLILQLDAADSHLEKKNPERAQVVVQQAMDRARTTLQEARRAIQALRPAVLESGNLTDAIGWEVERLAADTQVRTTFEVEGHPPHIPAAVAQEVLRIVQESLSNVTRHAQASQVHVRLAAVDEGFELDIKDDGVGFAPAAGAAKPNCYGLTGVQERAQRLGGELTVDSAPGQGATITLQVKA